MIEPDWPAPARVRALVTTRAEGDMGGEALKSRLPAEPKWLKQVHGSRVVVAEEASLREEADAAIARSRGAVCAVKVADCMPVLLADDAGSVVGAAHAGWRGLAGGVLENTVASMGVEPARLLAWLGPAIGPGAYEVGADVADAFRGYEEAFTPGRPGHWMLDLYAIARRRLRQAGVEKVFGGGFCTFTESPSYFSWRRSRDTGRMAACIWLT